jgi:DNA mismatch repair protein MutS2
MAARHPLLDPRSVVPIDLELGPGVRALVITGPNTGGKTVTLKTAGLLALMSQCGLHLPVESGSEISVFEAVFADIGDEQSIEQSLSTFSAHISNIIRILKQIDARALVVLDELGAGTDPQEGSALARALLQTFLDRRATTLVATHYPELKAFAHASERIRNASVEFDLESLRPTYHLMLGLPGRSNALAIAERLGLDREIIAAARAMISPDELRAEELLDEIHRERDLARQARAESEAARGRLQEQNRELLERLEAIEDERLEILDQARQEAQAGLDALQGELAQLRRQLELARQPLEALEAVSEKARELERQVKRPPKRASVKVEEHTRPLRAGDKVHLKTLNCEGLITYLESGQAEVQVGRLRVRADLNELRLVGAGGHEASSEPRAKRRKPPAPAMGGQPAPAPPPLEMDLRGQTVEEALLEVDRRLDAAFLSGMPFLRLIHGKGSGRLREAIRDALRGNPYVGSYRAGDPGEGGEGVTVVKLAPN